MNLQRNDVMKLMIQHLIVLLAWMHATHAWAQVASSTHTVPKTDAYADGLLAEEREQDYVKAAEHYRSVIREFDAQRNEAANAVFRLGECLRKLGRLEEAKVQYARVLREFPDFVELTKQSHVHLVDRDDDKETAKQRVFPMAELERYGLMPQEVNEQTGRIREFLKMYRIDLPISVDSRKNLPGLNFPKDKAKDYSRISDQWYQQLNGKYAEDLVEIFNDVNEMKKATMIEGHSILATDRETIFLPLLPEFFAQSAAQIWRDAKLMSELNASSGGHYTILGEISKPDVYVLPGHRTINLVEAIAKAGGFTVNAKTSRISRIRDGEEKRFDFDALLKSKDTSDADVIDGDRIVVPVRFF